MTTAAKPDVVVHGAHDPDVDRNKTYVVVALILAVMTALEVAASEVSGIPGWVALSTLMVLMVLKFIAVTAFFMHLKFDKKSLTVVFYSSLVLALSIYLAVLLAFRFFTPETQMIS
jgi:caa(3)-type oxidase subunit IV